MSFFLKRAGVLAQLSCVVSVLSLCGQGANAQETAAVGGKLSATAQAKFAVQFKAFQTEKAALTPAQRKLATPLAMAIPAKKSRVTANFKAFRGFAATGAGGRSDVIITGHITSAVLNAIKRFGGTVLSEYDSDTTVRALLSPAAAEQVATLDEVRYIKLYKAPITHSGAASSEGDVAHAASPTRDLFNISGAGIKIGVLSDGVTSLKRSIDNGELPLGVTVIKSSQGKLQSGTGDEGTAMLEIVHDIAPRAQLFFASGYGGKEQFAENIRGLRKAGCNIIVDDLLYFDEAVYQDDVVSQAVTDVVKDGALYFSSAGNMGNSTMGTSATWDGQFRAGESISTTKGIAQLHLWEGEEANTVIGAWYGAQTVLHWADPLGSSTNDYDMYVLDSDGDIVFASQDDQAITGAPYEEVISYAGNRIVVTLVSGEPRPLHLGVFDGQLAHGTPGATYGHMASADAIGVAAVDAVTDFTKVIPFTGKSVIETFSSDGPRTYYFDAKGKKKTYTVKAPQIAAADGVVTSVPGFTRFYGTSAAAPHAAAVAALIWSYDRSQSNKEVKDVLYKTALDIMGSGYDRDSGHGLVMVDRALAQVGPPVLSLSTTEINVKEGNIDTRQVKVTLKLSKAANTNITAAFTTKSGTARSDQDFVSKSGTVTVPKGAKQVDVYFAIKGDKTFEPDETFTVNFSKISLPVKGSKTVSITIANDDAAPAGTSEPSQSSS